MKKETMSITRGLKELKLLSDRIQSGVRRINSVDLKQEKFKGQALLSKETEEQFVANAKASYQSVVSLMERREKIKSAIVLANTSTKVKIGNREMTIAEAIEMKNSLDGKKLLLQHVRSQHARVSDEIENNRERIESQVNNLLAQSLNKDKKTNPEEWNLIAAPFIAANEMKVIDPLGAAKLIEDLDTEITEFEANVDIALSEINSKTEIVIETNE